MKQLIGLSLAALLGMAATSWGGGFLCVNCGIHCMVPPEPCHEDCDCPCNHGRHLCSQWKSEHAHKLIEDLDNCCDCCARIKAVEKLGCPLHADWCCDPEVLAVLIRELRCDKCWEVRRVAAWGIQHQNARTEEGVLALYIASKTDRHYLVRVAAAEALDILTLNHKTCFVETLKGADVLIVQLKKLGYKPGPEQIPPPKTPVKRKPGAVLQTDWNSVGAAWITAGYATNTAYAELVPAMSELRQQGTGAGVTTVAPADILTTPATLSPMPGTPLATDRR
jgi:hypothetical protein